MENRRRPQISAVHARFILIFPVLFFLSLAAHAIGGGGLPAGGGLFAGAIFAALFSALVSRGRLTVASVSTAALASQSMVHWSFHYVHGSGVQGLGAGHHHHVGPILNLTPTAAHSAHAMFTPSMLAAHVLAGVVVAVVLVQVDHFLGYLGTAAKRLTTLLQPVLLIAPRGNRSVNFLLPAFRIHVFLAVITNRGPPRSLKFLSI